MTHEHPLRWIRRRIFGATQEQLAAIGGVSRPRVSRYETGADAPPFGFMKKIRAEALQRGQPFSGDWFFERPDEASEAADTSAEANP